MITRRQILSLPLISGLTAMLDKTPKVLLGNQYSNLGLPLTPEEIRTLSSGDRIIVQDVESGEFSDTIVSTRRVSFMEQTLHLTCVDSTGRLYVIWVLLSNIDVIQFVEQGDRGFSMEYPKTKIFRHPTIKSGFGV